MDRMAGRTGQATETVAERLRSRFSEFTSAERKAARALLGAYPVAGLEPVAKLAAAAGVSAPTVLRLAAKLSFPSYVDFQQALKAEVAARMSSPLEMHSERSATPADDALHRAERILCGGIRDSFARLPEGEFKHAVQLLADTRFRVTLVGGRFSSALAEYLAAHLRILRPNVSMVSTVGGDRMGSLLDIGRRDVVGAFDYRRYQRDTIRITATAKQQGATIVAFTDPYLSPLAAHADVILTSSVSSPSPFDALTPAVALVEALIAALVDKFGDAPRARMARYDALHSDSVTNTNRASVGSLEGP